MYQARQTIPSVHHPRISRLTSRPKTVVSAIQDVSKVAERQGRVHRDGKVSISPRFCAPRSNAELPRKETGNKVARKATLLGTQHIMLGGKTVIMADAMIRGDLARTAPSSGQANAPGSNTSVFIGRYCFLSKGCCLRPPGRIYKGYVAHQSAAWQVLVLQDSCTDPHTAEHSRTCRSAWAITSSLAKVPLFRPRPSARTSTWART
jgi:hypothetical protein